MRVIALSTLRRFWEDKAAYQDAKEPVLAWYTCASLAPTPSTIASTRRACDGALRMDIKPIRTKRDYRAALKEIESLMAARAGTPEGERLDILATLVEAYEKKHF